MYCSNTSESSQSMEQQQRAARGPLHSKSARHDPHSIVGVRVRVISYDPHSIGNPARSTKGSLGSTLRKVQY